MKIILALFLVFGLFYGLYLMYVDGEENGGSGIFYVIGALILFWMVWH
jgi:hypothetical protein